MNTEPDGNHAATTNGSIMTIITKDGVTIDGQKFKQGASITLIHHGDNQYSFGFTAVVTNKDGLEFDGQKFKQGASITLIRRGDYHYSLPGGEEQVHRNWLGPKVDHLPLDV